MTVVLGSSPAAPRASRRRRSWLQTAAIGLVVLIYLCGWTIYATTHTTDSRYRLLEAGAPGTTMGAEWRLLELVQTSRLVDSSSGEPGPAAAGTTFVVAQLERVPRTPSDSAACTANLLGPGGRVWEASSYTLDVQRDAPRCSSEDVVVGQSYRFENVYIVPTAFVDQVVGIALADRSNAERSLVLQPPA